MSAVSSSNKMNDLYRKISTKFELSWDICDLEKSFLENMIDPDGDRRGRHLPYSDPNGNPHWQAFPAGISFARNFYINYKNECTEVAEKIKELQDKLRNVFCDHLMTEMFLEHTIDPRKVNVVKIPAGVSVKAHNDATRSLSLNIGLVNSSCCETQIINVIDNNNFDKYEIDRFIMEDGDVFLLNVKNTHRVNALVSPALGLNRYLISYTIATI